MLEWFKRTTIGPPARPSIHPPWRAGQYVTYFLERTGGSWTSISLRIIRRMDDGAWLLCADLKTRSGESRVWLRSDPAAAATAIDPTPGRLELIRGAPIQSIINADHPQNQVVLAINLLLVRRGNAAQAALQNEPREVHFPCGIDRVYPLIAGKLQHDLSPRVLLTGLACSSFDGGKNATTVTSFGCSDPAGNVPGTYDDFLDLSHLIRVDHEGFSLTYPATWFLRLTGRSNEAPSTAGYAAKYEGNTCAGVLSVTLIQGDAEKVTIKRDSLLRHLEKLPESTAGVRRRTDNLPNLSGDAQAFAFDSTDGQTDGYIIAGIYRSAERNCLAQVNVTGIIAKANPRREDTREHMRLVFPQIVASFHFA